MKHFILALLATAGTAINANSQVMVKASPGDGVTLINADSTLKINLGFRFQTLLEMRAPSDDAADIESRFMIRRSRIKASGFAFSPKLEYKVELGLSQRDIGPVRPETNNAPLVILDAVAKYKAAKNLSLWVGQTKLPGNRERVISSQQLQFVDRSIVNSDFNLDRDMGVQLHYKQKVAGMEFRQAIAVSQGEGRNIVQWNQGLAYTARVEWLPMGSFHDKGDYVGSAIYREESPKLSIGASYEYNDEARRSRGQLGSFLDEPRDLQTGFADMMFKWGGFSMMSEFASRDFEIKNVDGTDEDVLVWQGYGFNVQAGYLLKSGFEVAGRYSMNDFTASSGIEDENMYTLGFSRFFSGHDLKVQSDFSYITEGTNPTGELLFRLQMEVAL